MPDIEPTILSTIPLPTNVIAAIARVESEIGGIKKLTPAERAKRGMGGTGEGITYAYRSIDQVAAEAQRLFGDYGVVIVPNVIDVDIVAISKGSNSNWTRTSATVRWDLYGPGGTTDMISSTTIGLGDDNSDKGMNKAMTAAFKNLLLRILCIGDPNDDPDSARHTYDDPSAGPPVDVSEWQDAIAKITPPQRLALMKHGATLGVKSIGAPGDQVNAMRRALDNILAGREAHEDAAAPEPQPETPADEPPVAAEAPPKSRAAQKREVVSNAISDQPPHDHIYVREVCTICGESEPF